MNEIGHIHFGVNDIRVQDPASHLQPQCPRRTGPLRQRLGKAIISLGSVIAGIAL